MIAVTGGYHPDFADEKWTLEISAALPSQTAHQGNS